MAIAFDAVSTKSQDAASSATWAHTCTGDNRALVVGVEIGTGQTVTGVTYNSVAMTRVNTQAIGGSTFNNVYLYYLINPSTGANNIVVSGSGSTFIYCAATSYTGVFQVSTYDSQVASSTTGTAITLNTITQFDSTWLVGFFSKGTATAAAENSAGANTTIRGSDSNSWFSICDSNGAKSPPGTYSLSINISTSRLVGLNIVSLIPVGVRTSMLGEGWAQAGLVAGYHLSDTTDFSGNNYHLTNTGTTTFVAGKFNLAPDFNGTSQYLSIADASCPNLEILGVQTWSCWIKPDVVNAVQMILAKENTASRKLYLNSDAKIYWDMDGLTDTGANTDITLSAGNWYYVVGVYDGAALKIYLNGALAKSDASTGTPTDTNGPFNIGSRKTTAELFFNGKIDEVQIYNVAKDARWVRQQYAIGVGKFY